MRKTTLSCLFLLACLTHPVVAQMVRRPKLVIVIVVDQFRYDYLTRFRQDYKGGIATLLEKGAVFTNARYPQFPTVTAVGHSIIMTGAVPAMSGIVGNAWYSRDEQRVVTAICDDAYETVGAPSRPPIKLTPEGTAPDCNDLSTASPNRLLVDTVSDELKIVSDQTRVIGISLKPRAAILPAGHMANGAYWFDDSGAFVTSSYYMNELPKWATVFNKKAPADQYAGRDWMGNKFASGGELYRNIAASPWGNELIESFAEAAIEGEQLGQRGVTDVLTVSFSSNDYIGHRVGPDDPQVRDISIRTDQQIDRLFKFLQNKAISLDDVLVVFSADHGVAPLPDKNFERRIPGSRMSPGTLLQVMQDALVAKYGPGNWILNKAVEYVVYLNSDLIKEHKLDHAEVDRTAAEALSSTPYVFRVYTREQLANGVSGDRIARAMVNDYFPRRSGDLFILLDPNWIFGMSGTTHGTPFNYDAHVPVILMGSGIKPGRYNQNVSVTDIAPTLATFLGIEMPSGADGRTLAEIFSEN